MARPSVGKACVFCGERPSEKTKEHILPKWLLNSTDTTNKMIVNGMPHMSFRSLTLPACWTCNNAFSDLEGRAKPIADRLLESCELVAGEVDTLLDWLDKVRTGLWLVEMVHSRNPLGIEPNFFASDRIAAKDRFVAVRRSGYKKKALSFAGTTTTAFHVSPSVFALIINDLILVNASWDGLLQGSLGTPYLRPIRQAPEVSEKAIAVELVDGSGRISRPAFTRQLVASGVVLAQPIVRMMNADRQWVDYADKFSRQEAIDIALGKAAIFYQDRNNNFLRAGMSEGLITDVAIRPVSDRAHFLAQVEVLRLQKVAASVAATRLLPPPGYYDRQQLASAELLTMLDGFTLRSASILGFRLECRTL